MACPRGQDRVRLVQSVCGLEILGRNGRPGHVEIKLVSPSKPKKTHGLFDSTAVRPGINGTMPAFWTPQMELRFYQAVAALQKGGEGPE